MLDTIRDLKKKLIKAQKEGLGGGHKGSVNRKGSGAGNGAGGGGGGGDGKGGNGDKQ